MTATCFFVVAMGTPDSFRSNRTPVSFGPVAGRFYPVPDIRLGMIGPVNVMPAKLAYSNSFGRVSITHRNFTASHQQCERQRTKSPDEHRGGDNDFPSITK